MRDEYTSAFYNIVKETQDRYGYDLPFDIEVYVVMLLSSRVDKPDFLPTESFAESYMKLKGIEAKNLGDTCLFTMGVFPEYGARKGLTPEYFSNIGMTSYDIATSYLDDSLFSDLRDHFLFLSNFINVCVTNQDRIDISSFLRDH